jgi:hypothetical protein
MAVAASAWPAAWIFAAAACDDAEAAAMVIASAWPVEVATLKAVATAVQQGQM